MHLEDISVQTASIGLKYWFLSEVLYVVSTGLVRSAVALLLLRLTPQPTLRKIIYGAMCCTLVNTVIAIPLVTFQCSPPSFFWEQVLGRTDGTCLNPSVLPGMTMAYSVTSFIVDCILALLPIALLWNVDMDRRLKALSVILLGLGLMYVFPQIPTLP